MVDDLRSLSDIAHQLGIPESTVEYYANRFGSYAPTVDVNGETLYRPEAVEVFRITHQLMESDHRPSEIDVRLARLFPKTVPVLEQSTDLVSAVKAEASVVSEKLASVVVPVLVSQAEAMTKIADALDRMSRREEETRALSSISRAISELANADRGQASSAALEQTASALQALAAKQDEIRALESQIEELKKAQEAADLKRRISEARREREQKERLLQTEEKLMSVLSQKKRPWWRFWKR
jgi:DNA-binding transcriptional MerR regulator